MKHFDSSTNFFNSRFLAFALISLLCPVVAGAEDGQRENTVTVRPFHTGICQIGKDHVLGDAYSEHERMDFIIYSFLVEGTNGEKALIDLGPKSLDYCNAMFVRHGLFRDLGSHLPDAERFPDQIRQPRGNVFAQLSKQNVSPAAINHLIFSHLHADHHGMHDATDGGAAEHFPRALLHISARGWNDNLGKRTNGHWNSYVDFAFGDFLMRAEEEGRCRFADDSEVIPGVRTLYLGGHAPCSQAVLLDTGAGLAIIASDDVYLYSLLEENILPRIRTSRQHMEAALDRLAMLAIREDGILVAMHDPMVWKTFEEAGDRWLEALKPISDRAVRGYARHRGWEPTAD